MNYTYNDHVLLNSLYSTTSTYIASTEYDAAARIISRNFANGLAQEFNYYAWDTAMQGGRLQTMLTGSGAWHNDTFNFDANLQRLTYTYDANGNILDLTNTTSLLDETNHYGYDALNRLENWNIPGKTSETYSYDPTTGDLSAKAGVGFGYNDASHVHAVTSTDNQTPLDATDDNHYTYDADGNMVCRVEGGNTYKQDYNVENQLIAVQRMSGGCGGTAIKTTKFVYDGDGRRVQMIDGGVTTTFVGNYYEATGSTITKYYFAGTQRIAMRKYTIPENGTLTYLFGDHLGSTSLAVTGSDVVETRYKPWGEVRFTTEGKSLPTRYTFTGQYSYVSDDATDLGSNGFGLMFYNARFYSPYINHFISPDTIIPDQTSPQSWDRYSYVNNNPLRYTDPTGHAIWQGDGGVGGGNGNAGDCSGSECQGSGGSSGNGGSGPGDDDNVTDDPATVEPSIGCSVVLLSCQQDDGVLSTSYTVSNLAYPQTQYDMDLLTR